MNAIISCGTPKVKIFIQNLICYTTKNVGKQRERRERLTLNFILIYVHLLLPQAKIFLGFLKIALMRIVFIQSEVCRYS